LEGLFERAGLHPETLGVFPDYRFPRLVFAPRLLETAARPLAWRVPRFPTPSHPSHEAASVLDELRVWRGLVEAGVGADFANSFLVVAGRDAPQTLWPDDLLGASYSSGRRRRYATESRVVESGDVIVLARRALGLGEREPTDLVHRCDDRPYLDGVALIELLADAVDEAELRRWHARFRAYLEREIAAAGDIVPFDMWPGNLLVVDGGLAPADTEFAARGITAGEVFDRAMLLLAIELSGGPRPSAGR
jgi:hypothetical protein